MAPLPKRKRSKNDQGKIRSHAHLTLKSISPCPQCHSPRLPHRVCKVCGTYNGRQVVQVATQAG